jgi:hypothetical protein
MRDQAKPIVRLDHPTGGRKPRKSAPPAGSPITKLAIRLTVGVNEAPRLLIRYRGDLSLMAIEAVESVELTTVMLVSSDEELVRDTTISLPTPLHKKLKDIALERGTSMNILVNIGLAHWLAAKGSIKLR